MSERPESTLGYERLSQPLLKLEEEAFVREILASVPPMPSYYPRMKELNSKGASSVADLPGKVTLTPARVSALLADESVTVIDLRRPEACGVAHIPGVLNIAACQNLSLWAGCWTRNNGSFSSTTRETMRLRVGPSFESAWIISKALRRKGCQPG